VSRGSLAAKTAIVSSERPPDELTAALQHHERRGSIFQQMFSARCLQGQSRFCFAITEAGCRKQGHLFSARTTWR
jgi:hypothetical protein